MDTRSFRISPQQIDPLSWYTRPLVPAALAAMMLLFSVGSVVITWQQLAEPGLDIVAILLIVAACLTVQFRTRPMRGAFRPVHAILPLGLMSVGLAVSTFANLHSVLSVQFWWAPVGVATVIGTLSPFSSPRAVIAYGAVFSVLTGLAGTIAFLVPAQVWPPLSVFVVASSSVVVATVAASVFSWSLVQRTRSLLSWAGAVVPDESAVQATAADHVERKTVARLGARVAPFLESVADAGEVTERDRALAGQLARRLRSDLVESANRSWLDAIPVSGRIFVVDPERRANHMNAAQRSALRGLVLAALSNPTTDAGSLFIELRGQADGSTAVALSLDLDLPEGRRSMMLAPYYLALQMTVGDVSWDPARELLRFEVPRTTKP